MPDPLVLRTDDERDDWLAEETGMISNPAVEPSELRFHPELASDPQYKRLWQYYERKRLALKPELAALTVKDKAKTLTSEERRRYKEIQKAYTAVLDARQQALTRAFPFEGSGESLVQAGEKFSLLSLPEKMACYSFGISSMFSCPGAEASAKLHSDERLGICWQCYATKGNYDNKRLVKALTYYRMLWTQDKNFEDTMAEAIGHPGVYKQPDEWTDPRFFRIHDSGDCYSADYARKWLRIIKRCPDTIFWMPTRVWAVRNRFLDAVGAEHAGYKELYEVLCEINREPNCLVKPSALAFDDVPPNAPGGEKAPGLGAGATSIFVKEPKGWNLTTRGALARQLTGEKDETASFGVVKPDWSPDTRRRLERDHDTFICPATDYPEPRFNCTTMPGPDGKRPCRICWGWTATHGLHKPKGLHIPAVAYKWH